MTDISKPTMLGHCRGEVVEALAEQFDAAAERSGATALEVLVAAVTFASMTADFIPNPKQRAAMLAVLTETNLQ